MKAKERMGRTGNIAAAALLCSIAMTGAAGAKPAGAGDGGKPDGIACQQAGISTLQSLGLLAAVAENGIEVVGLGTVDFATVLSLHRTNPEFFDGSESAVTVVVPGVGEVVANWCA